MKYKFLIIFSLISSSLQIPALVDQQSILVELEKELKKVEKKGKVHPKLLDPNNRKALSLLKNKLCKEHEDLKPSSVEPYIKFAPHVAAAASIWQLFYEADLIKAILAGLVSKLLYDVRNDYKKDEDKRSSIEYQIKVINQIGQLPQQGA